jgi:Flp pilus assembly protein protease CpaA
MLSNDTIVVTNATMIVGVLILVSVRQSMKLRSNAGFFITLVAVIVIFAVSAIAAILNFAGADVSLAAGFAALLAFLGMFAYEAVRQERVIR